MKTLIIIISLCLSAQLLAKDLLSEGQQRDIITTIDNLCGDTWCEGDYDFNFQSIKCNSNTQTCTVEFQLLSIIWDDDYQRPVFTSTFNAQCKITPIKSLSDIIFMHGYNKYNEVELNQDFYQQLSDCIMEKEQEADQYFNQKMEMFY